MGNHIRSVGRGFQKTLIPQPKTSLFQLLAAIAFVIAGQIIVKRTIPIHSWQTFTQNINNWLRVDVKYLSNVMLGMSCTVVGGFLFAAATQGSSLLADGRFQVFSDPKKVLLKNLNISKWWNVALAGFLILGLLLYRASRYTLEFYDPFLWVTSIFLLAATLYKYDRAEGRTLTLSISTLEKAGIVFLFIFALVIGTYQLQDIPNIIKGDEGNFFETARFIINGDFSGHIFGFGVYSYPVFSNYFQAGILGLFGADIWGWRFSSVLPAMMAVIPLYLIGKILFNRWVSIIASLAYITSPYLLSFARLGYNNAQSILFVTLCICLYLLGIKKGSLFYMGLSGMVAGLGFLTYTAGRLGLVILVGMSVYLIHYVIRKKMRSRFLAVGFLMICIGWAVTTGPHLVYGNQIRPSDHYHKLLEGFFLQADFAGGLFGEEAIFETHAPINIQNNQLFYQPVIIAKLLLRGILRSFMAFQLEELNPNYFLTSPLAGPIAVIFYVFGFYAVLTHFWRANTFPIFLWFSSALFLLSTINTYPPRQAHIIPVIPAVSLMVGLGVYLMVDHLMKFLRQKNISWLPSQSSIILVLCLAIMIAGTIEYFSISPNKHRPNLENIMSWTGLHNPADTRLVYIYEHHEQDKWKPYLFRVGLTSAVFESRHIDDVVQSTVTWPKEDNAAIFVEEPLADTLVPAINTQFRNPEWIIFRNRAGKPIGRAAVRGSVHFSSTAPLGSGLSAHLTSRVMWIVGPLTLLGLYYLLPQVPQLKLGSSKRFLSEKQERSSTEIAAGQNSSSSPMQTTGLESSAPPHTRLFELGIFFHLRTKKARRYLEAKFSINKRKEPLSEMPGESSSNPEKDPENQQS